MMEYKIVREGDGDISDVFTQRIVQSNYVKFGQKTMSNWNSLCPFSVHLEGGGMELEIFKGLQLML
jgi:hypothetical protein